jgi:hypothetical protein
VPLLLLLPGAVPAVDVDCSNSKLTPGVFSADTRPWAAPEDMGRGLGLLLVVTLLRLLRLLLSGAGWVLLLVVVAC